MLLTMAGRCNSSGMIFLTENIPYTPKMLADELDFEENTVLLALKSLEQLNMIVTDNGFFSIAGWEEYQNIEGMDKIREQNRARVAKHREKQRLLACNSQMTCQYCGGKATGVDHILALSRGGKDTESNKVPCCIECNRIKNDKPLVDFLNQNRERISDEIVLSNSKLSQLVTLCNVTGCYIVTLRNATDIDKEEDKEKEEDNNIMPDSDESDHSKSETYKIIISYLNEKAGTSYKATSKKTQSLINARMTEGFSVDDFKTVIDKKCTDWLETDFAEYLRPTTLFGTKFESYLNAPTKQKQQKQQAETPEFLKKWSI